MKLKAISFYYSSVVDVMNIAEESEHEANLYLFITGSKSPLGIKGMAYQTKGMGSVCDNSRGNRQVLVRYVEDMTHDPCDPGNDAVCQNKEVCTGQVILFSSTSFRVVKE